MSISIIASVFGFVYFINIDPVYSFSAIKHIPKILLYIFLLLLLDSDRIRDKKVGIILSGLIWGIGLNLFWSIADAISYYLFHISLTNELFRPYILATNMHYGIASIVDGFSIRSVGLNNDPATIGFFAIITAPFAFVTNRKWILLIAIFASLACVSFIGLAGIFIVCFYYFLKGKIKIKNFAISFILIGFLLFIFLNSNNQIIESLKTAIELRTESKVGGDHSSGTRILFIAKFPNAVLNHPISLILGTGYSTAVYAYYPEGLDYGGANNYPTYMENTYVDDFFSFGLIGFILFVAFYAKMFIIYKNKLKFNSLEYKFLYSISLATLISYFFYHYTLYSVIMLASIAGVIYHNPRTQYKAQISRSN